METKWRSSNTPVIVIYIIGCLFLIIAQYVPWVSQQFSPWEFYKLNIGYSYSAIIFIFPLISSIIIAISIIFIIIKQNHEKILIISIDFLVLMLLTVFFIQMFKDADKYIYNSVGVFFGIFGYAFSFLGLFLILLGVSTDSENTNKGQIKDLKDDGHFKESYGAKSSKRSEEIMSRSDTKVSTDNKKEGGISN
ncbi:MAG: hypothetical protein ACTSU2_01460 [Promethearchaeota archaeon]